MLDFYGEHCIVADIEAIETQEVNEGFERILKSNVRYSFAIDMFLLR